MEQRILELQEAKRAIATGALARLSPEEARRTRLADLCKLFDGFESEIAAEAAKRALAVGESRRETYAPPGAKSASHIDAEALAEVTRALPPLLVD